MEFHSALGAPSLSTFLDAMEATLSNKWERRFATTLPAAEVRLRCFQIFDSSILRQFLDIIKNSENSNTYSISDTTEILKQCLLEEKSVIFDLQVVLQELQILRQILSEEMDAHKIPGRQADKTINCFIDCAMIVAGSEFSRRMTNQTTCLQKDVLDADESKTEMLATMTHEIRTPLSAILGFSDLMSSADLPSSEREEFGKIVSESGAQLSSLINTFLDLSKIESGKIEAESIATSLKNLAVEVVNLLRISTIHKNIQMNIHCDGNVPDMLLTDPMRLKQILTNLVGNAIKFTESGEVNILIKPYSCHEDSLFCFIVTDTGIGMTASEQKRLFKPYSQATKKTSRTHGGTGLGLVLSKTIARALGGDLELTESTLGKGSTFTATFRCSLIEKKEHSRNDKPVRKLVSEDLSDVRVLLADDSPELSFLVKKYLSSAGATVQLVNNGEEAIEKASNNHFDIVVMDMQMPILDGYAATSELRSRGYNVPIVALTASAMLADKNKSLKAGCNAYATKPVDQNKLVKLIKETLAQQ